jgi:hypothetical protein
MAIVHRHQAVQAQVGAQEARGERVAVAAGDIGAAAVADQAGQRQAAADLEDAFTGTHVSQREPRRQRQPRRPGQAEQRPGGGRDSDPACVVVRIVELPAIDEGSDEQVVNAVDRDASLVSGVAGHVCAS